MFPLGPKSNDLVLLISSETSISTAAVAPVSASKFTVTRPS